MLNNRIKFNKSLSGFTIPELLIVIAIIGILATITILGYSGWRSSVDVAQMKSDLKGAVSAMEDSRNFGNAYPAAVPTSFKPSAGTTLTGGSFDGKNYCLLATISGVMYRSTNVIPEPTSTTLGCIGTYSKTTPGSDTWSVPAGVTNIMIEVWGAQGYSGTSNGCGSGGGGAAGGYSKGFLAVVPADPVYVNSGGMGGGGAGGGWNGYSAPGGAGGGASDIRYGGNTLADRKIVAGGGGGGGGGYDDTAVSCDDGAPGGTGGGASGVNGGYGTFGGAGGTQTTGFALSTGGSGSLACGGGGAGYYGGFGGSSSDQYGGGGGSGYVGGVTGGTMSNGVQGGNGKVLISYYYP